EASGTPLRGEIKNKSDKEVVDGGRSATTSSKRKTISFGRTPTAPESGVIDSSCGAATSGGPPGGIPGDAHASPSNATAISRRKVLSPFQRAARDALTNPVPSCVLLQRRWQARGM